jgi:Domain of unknown function (DUF1841)
MLFTGERLHMREVFFRAWRNYRAQKPLEEIEQVIVNIALRHPEYHTVLDNPSRYEDRDYLPETGQTNPFLHMALHIAIHEQLSTARPAGIREAYQLLLQRFDDAHITEHHMMECLAQTLWQAQRRGDAPSEDDYLKCLHKAAAR